MTDLFPPTVTDMIAECERELKARAHVYPRLIQAGKLSTDKAARQVALLQAIMERLKVMMADVAKPVGPGV